MPRRQTPLEVMFSLFKTSFTQSHRALAELLLSDLPLTNGQPTAQMSQDTSWLSRTSGTALNSQRTSGRLPPQVFLSVHAI